MGHRSEWSLVVCPESQDAQLRKRLSENVIFTEDHDGDPMTQREWKWHDFMEDCARVSGELPDVMFTISRASEDDDVREIITWMSGSHIRTNLGSYHWAPIAMTPDEYAARYLGQTEPEAE